MHAFATLASLALLAVRVHAGIYITSPVQSTSCSGGGTCTVTWIDDGQAPSGSQIGECTVGLYTGEEVLAQSLPTVDSTSGTFTFTVDPNAGPSGSYYIEFTSVNDPGYSSWSSSFALTDMTGSTPDSSSVPPTTATGSTTPSGSSVSVPASSGSTASATTVASASSATQTTPSTTVASVTSASASASASATNAAARIGSSASVGGMAALLVLSGVLAF